MGDSSPNHNELPYNELIRLWEFWSREYWAAEFLKPNEENVAEFRRWIEFAEEGQGEDVGDEVMTYAPELLMLYAKMAKE